MTLTGIASLAGWHQIRSKIRASICKCNSMVFGESPVIQRLGTVETTPAEISDSPKPLLESVTSRGIHLSGAMAFSKMAVLLWIIFSPLAASLSINASFSARVFSIFQPCFFPERHQIFHVPPAILGILLYPVSLFISSMCGLCLFAFLPQTCTLQMLFVFVGISFYVLKLFPVFLWRLVFPEPNPLRNNPCRIQFHALSVEMGAFFFLSRVFVRHGEIL